MNVEYSFESNYVRTRNGWLHGVTDDYGNHVYRGIPFAAPPVGERRFKDPAPALNWQGVREADHYGPEAVQMYGAFDAEKNTFVDDPDGRTAEYSGEDCLYLNIWSPAKSEAEKLPVFVWIHGGAFMGGSGSGFLYRGGSLAQRGIVVVTINYRMSVLGFLSHPSFARHGNFAIMDQTMALRWVKDNIEVFGGDPDQITVGGQSAGACSVGCLINSPYTEGLFSRAVMESGTMYGCMLGATKEKAQMDALGEEFVSACLGGVVTKLYTMDALELTKLGNAFVMGKGEGLLWRPCIDGDVIEKPMDQLFREQTRGIDILTGCTEYEFLSDYSPEALKEGISEEEFTRLADALRSDTDTYDALKKAMPYTTKEESLYQYSRLKAAAILSDMKDMASVNAEKGNKTFVYQFRKYTADPKGLYKSPHSAELPYLFGVVGRGGAFPWIESPWTAADFAMMHEVQTLWSDFVKGNPMKTADGREWKPCGGADEDVMILG